MRRMLPSAVIKCKTAQSEEQYAYRAAQEAGEVSTLAPGIDGEVCPRPLHVRIQADYISHA
jgi:hypothetical protein